MDNRLFIKTALAACLGALPVIPSQAGAPTQDAISNLAAENFRFGLDLYQDLASRGGNLILSPHSISTALAMLQAGARGRTLEEMSRALHLANLDGDTAQLFHQLQEQLLAAGQAESGQLRIANSIWTQSGYPFLPEYLNLVRDQFGGQLRALDYAQPAGAAAEINRWVTDQTQGKIPELISPSALTPLTRLVLVNAICFKGRWASPFNPRATRTGDWHLPDSQSVPAAFMTQTSRFGYAEGEGVQVLEMPYAGGRLSMAILLPRARAGLPEVERRLARGDYAGLLGQLARRQVRVDLPKFTFRTRFDLNQPLQQLGMKQVFSATHADLSGIDGRPHQLYLSKVVHQAFIEVAEEGTEAAGATGAVVSVRSAPGAPVAFRADHPFLFLIRDRLSGATLFLGRLADPGHGLPG